MAVRCTYVLVCILAAEAWKGLGIAQAGTRVQCTLRSLFSRSLVVMLVSWLGSPYDDSHTFFRVAFFVGVLVFDVRISVCGRSLVTPVGAWLRLVAFSVYFNYICDFFVFEMIAFMRYLHLRCYALVGRADLFGLIGEHELRSLEVPNSRKSWG